MKSSYDSKSTKSNYLLFIFNIANRQDYGVDRMILKFTIILFYLNLFCFIGAQTRTVNKLKAKRDYSNLLIIDHAHTYPNYVLNQLNDQQNYNDFSSEESSGLMNSSQNFILGQFKQKQNQLDKSSKSSSTKQKTSTNFILTTSKIFTDCTSLFDKCFCSFNQDIQRYFLYCNDQSIKKIPDFKQINNLFKQNVKTNKFELSSLIFSKIDFIGSGIKRIKKDDLKFIQFDFYNPKTGNINTNSFSLSSFESYLDELKKSIVPMYHLDFDNIIDIEDGSFDEFTSSSLNLTFQLSSLSDKVLAKNEILLRIRFSNSQFNFAPNRKPFKGLKAHEFHINNMSNEYLANSIFDQSIISELYIENSLNFVGFLDLSENLPSGKLLNRFIVTRSYQIDSLCSHSLPSFIDQENFHEITVKKCTSLNSIKAFTFYKYRHLKTLTLSGNSLNKIDKDSFRYLSQLEQLDLSSNPINVLEDETFRDLSTLKRLFIESTLIKQINEKTLVGLASLNELRLTKSSELSEIHGNAFQDSRKSLKELHLKDTKVKLLDSLEKDEIEPPYSQEKLKLFNMTKKYVWIDGLNLSLLNIDSTVSNHEFTSKKFEKLKCKIYRFLSPNTLVNLQRNQTCNCLIYLIYRQKDYPSFPRWEFKVPFCYRTQIKFYENNTRSFENINDRENDCNINFINNECFPLPTTTTSTTTTTTTTTTTKPTIRTTQRKINNPTTPEKRKSKFPKVNLKKLAQVILTIILITAISILLTIAGLKISKRISKRKKVLKLQSTRQRTSSNSSSNQATLNSNLPRTSSKTKFSRLVMPPSVMPPFTKNIPNVTPKNSTKQATINQLISQSTYIARSTYKTNPSETSALLMQGNPNDMNFNPNTASFSIGSSGGND